MDETKMQVLIDGLSVPTTGVSTTLLGTPTPTVWNPNVLLEVAVSNNTFNSYADNTDISVFVTVTSEYVSGLTSSASFNQEVRING